MDRMIFADKETRMNYKILIADDDTELVKMLRTFFELRNYVYHNVVGADKMNMELTMKDSSEQCEQNAYVRVLPVV